RSGGGRRPLSGAVGTVSESGRRGADLDRAAAATDRQGIVKLGSSLPRFGGEGLGVRGQSSCCRRGEVRPAFGRMQSGLHAPHRGESLYEDLILASMVEVDLSGEAGSPHFPSGDAPANPPPAGATRGPHSVVGNAADAPRRESHQLFFESL